MILVEETPSSRPETLARLPAPEPMGFVSAANGALGFGITAAIGLRMGPRTPGGRRGRRRRLAVRHPVAVERGALPGGVLFIVLANGGYAIMDRLARDTGKPGPWPAFEDIDFVALARGLGCDATSVSTYDELIRVLDEHLPTIASRTEPATRRSENRCGRVALPAGAWHQNRLRCWHQNRLRWLAPGGLRCQAPRRRLVPGTW